MAYDYIRRMYGLDFRPGQRVRLKNSNKVGTVVRERRSAGHHVQVRFVQVRFDGQRHALPCHPQSLIAEPHP